MEPLGIDERREVWGHVGSRENSRRVTGFPGRAERRGVWGARRIRGASRVSRDAPSVGGFGGPDEFEARHGFPGTRRALGGLGGPTNSRRVTGFPGRAERRGVWGARRIRGASRVSRDAPSVGGFGGPDEFEARHGFPGTRRALGGLGGPTNSRRVTGFPGRAERRGVWGALSRPPMR